MKLNEIKFMYFGSGVANSRVASGLLELGEVINACQRTDYLVAKLRGGDKNAKKSIPAFCPQGYTETRIRNIESMHANGLAMFDLDHIDAKPEQVSVIVNAMGESLKNYVMIYTTCSGEGLRAVFPRFKNLDILDSAFLLVKKDFPNWLKYLDTSTTDISRLSILTQTSDIHYVADGEMDICPIEPTEEQLKELADIKQKYGDIQSYIRALKTDNVPPATEGNTAEPNNEKEGAPSDGTKDVTNRPYKSYSKEMVAENDRLYADYRYRGRKISDIAESYITYKTHGMGPETGERHALYGTLCKNFRNLVDNNPCVLHAVLPQMTKGIEESWQQCCWYTSRTQSNMLPKDFYFWLKDRGFLEYKTDEEETVISPEDSAYEGFLKDLPPLPPIFREYVKIAPKWFKIPAITSLQCYTALLCSHHRGYYFDGMPISPTLYSIVYAPAGSGKSYTRRLRSLLKRIDERDKLAVEKAVWYDRQQRQNNGSGKLPEEIEWKQQLFASKTSLGEILRRQRALGNHHWLQDVGEFSIWAATIKKNKEEWSAFYRTSYDNEEFSQSYQTANSFRGKVAVYPIVHATCTIGQIKSFFTNIEDGLLTRFSFVPLLHQRYAAYQPWKMMSDADQARIDKVLKRLEYETYDENDEEPEDVDEDSKGSSSKKEAKEWDYEFKDPIYHDMTYLNEALIEWLESKRLSAQKDDNQALDQFRRRCARNAFVFGLICRALFGNNRKETQEKIIKCALWDAEVKLYYMRYLWEEPVNDELAVISNKRSGMRNGNVFDELPIKFNRQTLENMLMSRGYKTPSRRILSDWRTAGFIREIAKNTYEKVNTEQNG